ncbi:hypothetical protein [Amycolatopsis nalaikhensis]|uniref:Uncharacterized protein n=1 Tax=Amycolatopsis nalaikhensis TaxID=715472 RepID=A0ABY8XW49_9PSEU|nr:hypothetical protein [Amycolatopsis sp. 2-2]WIV59888.1 hypothetical protein QP939_15375 [Amycolatopsis sp. 2-2]
MLKSFLGWLRDYVIYTGIVGLAEGVLGILAFGGLLSALLGNSAIKAGAIVAVLLGVIGLYILLIANRVEWRSRTELDRRLLQHYCSVLKERHGHSWRIVSWLESAVVRPNGDATEVITVTAIVECDVLDFFAIRTGAGWHQSERVRRKVKVNVKSLEVDGIGGTRRDVTSTWLDDGRLEVLAHFGSPASRGDEIVMVIEKEWPGKCAPLMRERRPDEFALKFACAIGYLEYAIHLPEGAEVACDPVGLVKGQHDFSLAVKRNGAGPTEVCLVARGIPPRLRVGMRLDLKKVR